MVFLCTVSPLPVRTFLLELWEGLLIALRAIRVNKMRAILTTLGIVIGITSVTAMVTVISGIEEQFEQDMASLGADVLYVEKWPWAAGPGFQWWNYVNRPRVTADLADDIQQRALLVRATVPVVDTRTSVRSGQESLSGVRVNGVTAAYPRVHSVDLQAGAFFSEIDDQRAGRVAVLGADIADNLFPARNPIGANFRLGGERFRVVGVFERQGGGFDGGSRDTELMIPFATFRGQFGTRFRDVSVQVRVASPQVITEAREEITGVVRTARQIDALEENNFEINEQESLREQLAPVRLAIYSIGIFLTALALLVGGIGVMNIMFVSVKERTREIGIRKAVGARRSTILLQFLIEAVIVCLIGGLLGVLLSLPIAWAISFVLPASLGLGVILLAFGICVMVGVAFGLAPAWQAAKAHPIEALRYE